MTCRQQHFPTTTTTATLTTLTPFPASEKDEGKAASTSEYVHGCGSGERFQMCVCVWFLSQREGVVKCCSSALLRVTRRHRHTYPSARESAKITTTHMPTHVRDILADPEAQLMLGAAKCPTERERKRRQMTEGEEGTVEIGGKYMRAGGEKKFGKKNRDRRREEQGDAGRRGKRT